MKEIVQAQFHFIMDKKEQKLFTNLNTQIMNTHKKRQSRFFFLCYCCLLLLVSMDVELYAQDDCPGNTPNQPDLTECPDVNCTSKDFVVVDAFLSDGNDCPTCIYGEEQTYNLIVILDNKTGSLRGSAGFFGDVYKNGVLDCKLVRCQNDIPPGKHEIDFGEFTYTCGDEIDIKGITISWTSAGTNTGCPQDCGDLKPKCGAPGDITVRPPMVCPSPATIEPDCSVGTNGTGSITIEGIGGLAPYNYTLTPGNITNETGQFPDLQAGDYTITIEDSLDCSVDCDYTIGLIPTVNVTCPGTSTIIQCQTQEYINDTLAAWLAAFVINENGDDENADTIYYVAYDGGDVSSIESLDIDNFTTIPDECGGSVSIGLFVDDGCTTDTCGATFTVPGPPALTCTAPSNITKSACEATTDFAAWIGVFADSGGGCDPTVSYVVTIDGMVADPPITDLTTIAAPSECGGTVQIDVTVSDDCFADDATCSSTYTVPAPDDLALNNSCPGDPNLTGCATQSEIDNAWTTWITALQAITATGGCNPEVEYSTPIADLTKPDDCTNTQQQVSININAKDDCGTTTPITCTFTVAAYSDDLALNNSCPGDPNLTGCATQSEIDNAWTTWITALQAITAIGGCNPEVEYSTPIADLTKPDDCTNTQQQVSININAKDDCGTTTPITCTFTVAAYSDDLALNNSCPGDPNLTGCATQSEIDNAWTTWITALQAITAIGGCNPEVEYSTPIADLTKPTNCTNVPQQVSIDINAKDDCGTTTPITCMFTVGAYDDPVTISCPAPVSLANCTFEDQDALNTDFNDWKAQFVVTNPGCGITSQTYEVTIDGDAPITMNSLDGVDAPDILNGGTVAINFEATDGCSSPNCNSTYEITTAAQVEVSCPGNLTFDSCDFDDQEAVDNAFINWKDQFTLDNAGCGAETPTLSQTAPNLCTGGSVTINYTVTDGLTSASCSATFTINDINDVVVTGPNDLVANACDYADQAALNAAFATWIGQFEVTTEGCNTTHPDLSAYTAPDLCTTETITINYTHSDNCSSDTHTASFTFTQAAAITYTAPEGESHSNCEYADQDALNTAFTAWINAQTASLENSIIGGCDPEVSHNSGLIIDLCAGGSRTITWTITDKCQTLTPLEATFTLTLGYAVEVSCPANIDQASCFYGDQAALDQAFSDWLVQFTVDNPGCGILNVTDLSGETAPDILTGGTVTINFAANDLCTSDNCMSSFTVGQADAVAISCPDNVSDSQCDYADQAALDAAFQAWLDDFEVTKVGCGVTEPDLSGYAAPDLCVGGTTSVTYNVSDGLTSASCTKAFTINGEADIVVDGPASVDYTSCDFADQDELDAAFATWIGQFEVTTEGCNTTHPNLSAYTAPLLCTSQTISIDYTHSDNCSSDTHTASFTFTQAAAITYTAPEGETHSYCEYDDQVALNTAFDNWVAAQTTALENSLGGGCNPIVSNGGGTAPVLCVGGSTTVTWSITDLCETVTPLEATFTLTLGDAVEVSCPADVDQASCFYGDQATLDQAFSDWLVQFTVDNPGCGILNVTDLSGETAPDILTGGTVTINFAANDLCTSDDCTRTFTVGQADAVEVSCPADVSQSQCDYVDQEAVNTAFDNWINQFNVINPGCGITEPDLSGYSAPDLCVGGTTSVTYNVSDGLTSASCTKAFTINNVADIVVDGPASVDYASCDFADQDELDAAFATWIGQFEVTEEGCNTTHPDLSAYTAPLLCTSQTISIDYTHSDNCSSDTHSASFTFTQAADITYTAPSGETHSNCEYADQDALNTAFDNWVAAQTTALEASLGGGCNPQVSNGGGTAPVLCVGGSITVTWSITDLCETVTPLEATFTLTLGDAVEVSCPADVDQASCFYGDQATLDQAFADWIALFIVSNPGCDILNVTDLSGETAPDILTGGTVTINFAANDLCTSDDCTRTFTVGQADAVEVSCPADVSDSQCDYVDQEAVNTAFDNWVNQFNVINPGCGITEPDLSGYSAPDLCVGGTTSVTYNVSDGLTSASCTKAFTINGEADIVVDGPASVDYTSCDFADQDELDAAFATWIGQFEVTTEGCNTTHPNLSAYTAPLLCTSQTISIDYTHSDNCSSDTHSASFTFTQATDITYTAPSGETHSNCEYADQDALNTAFDNWVAAQTTALENSLGGGCNPIVSNGGGTAPVLCDGGSTTVAWTITDLCETVTPLEATFNLTLGDAVAVNCPANIDQASCFYGNQATLNQAFDEWIALFIVNNPGCGILNVTDLSGETAPNILTGGSVTINFAANDLCTSDDCTRTFTVGQADAVEVSCPADVSDSQCDYVDQEAVNTAFDNWINQFNVINPGCGITEPDLSGYAAPDLCVGGTTSVTYNVSDGLTSASCTKAFTINDEADIVVDGPASVDYTSCDFADQDELDAAFATWIGQFEVTTEGCNTTHPNLSAYTAPLLCTSQTISIDYTHSDNCSSDTHTASFTFTQAAAITYTAPEGETHSNCEYDDQVALNTAFDNWVAAQTTALENSLGGGCNPQVSNGGGTAPVLCVGGSTTVAWTITDLCETVTPLEATFEVTLGDAVEVNCPANIDQASCFYGDQEILDQAFADWIALFIVSNPGCGILNVTDLSGETAPDILTGGTVTINFAANDLCTSDDCIRTFTVGQADAVEVSCPADVSQSQCDYVDQETVNTAFDNWINQFNVINPGCGITEPDLSGYAAPDLCVGGTTSVTYTITDGLTTATCTKSFTIDDVADIVVTGPENVEFTSCAFEDQNALSTAFNNWKAEFAVTEAGCNSDLPNLDDFTAPLLCASKTITINYTHSDNCSNDTHTASFTFTQAAAITYTAPEGETHSNCEYADQDALNTAFDNWVAAQTTALENSLGGGCNPQVSNGGGTAPVLCVGGSTTVTWSITDLCETVTPLEATFEVTLGDAVEVNCPAPVSLANCAFEDQDALDQAFADWIALFSVTNTGCGIDMMTDLSTLVAPDILAGGTVNVTYEATDGCTSNSCTSSFTIAPAAQVEVFCPNSEVKNSCDFVDQDNLNQFFADWLADFAVTTDGCGVTEPDLSGYTAPDICAGGLVSVTYSINDGYTNASCTATFTVNEVNDVAVTGPANVDDMTCDYANQQELDDAFNAWKAQFIVDEPGCGVTAPTLNQQSPDRCLGGTVTIDYAVNDLCSSDSYSASFTITPAPAVQVSCPIQLTRSTCDYETQAELQAEIDAWKALFVVDEPGCGIISLTDVYDPQYDAPDLCSGGTITINYMASDGCTQDNCIAEFVLNADLENPVITDCPTQPHIYCSDETIIFPTPNATDNCGDVEVNQTGGITSGASGLAPGTYPVSFVATDDCGNNSLACNFEVVVLTPLTLEITDEICGQDTRITIDFVVNGGLPAYDNNETYTLTATTAGGEGNPLLSSNTSHAGETVTLTLDAATPLGTVVTITATDSEGCIITETYITSFQCCVAEVGYVTATIDCPEEPVLVTVYFYQDHDIYSTFLIITDEARMIIDILDVSESAVVIESPINSSGPKTNNSPAPAIMNATYEIDYTFFPKDSISNAFDGYIYAYNEHDLLQPNERPVKDKNISDIGQYFEGCYDIAGTPLHVPPPFCLGEENENVFEGNNGGVSPFYYNTHILEVCGGTGPYFYTWQTDGYVRHAVVGVGKVQIIYADKAVWYVTVTDANGCTTPLWEFTNNPEEEGGSGEILDIYDYQILPEVNGDENGSVRIWVEGGSGDLNGEYLYIWYDGLMNVIYTGSSAPPNSSFIGNLQAGWYSVRVIDDLDGNGELNGNEQYTEGWYWVPEVNGSGGGNGIRGKVEEEGIMLNCLPNPTKDIVYVELNSPIADQFQFNLYDMTGREIQNLGIREVFSNTKIRFEIDLSAYSAGIYFLKVQSVHQEQLLNRIVKVSE